MSKGQAAGLNMIRAWATASSQPYALQPSPGNFSEAMFRGLDYALDLARQYNLKVKPILSIVYVPPVYCVASAWQMHAVACRMTCQMLQVELANFGQPRQLYATVHAA